MATENIYKSLNYQNVTIAQITKQGLDSITTAINNLKSSFEYYYMKNTHGAQMRLGFMNFWKSFQKFSFQDVLKNTLLEVQEEINNQINPRSDANIDEFNANMETLKTDTIYGSAVEIKDGVNTFVSNVANSKSSAQITVNLLPVKCFGASIPAAAIVIDFSWLAPYRETILSLWRFFFWASYFWLLFKRLPDILHGAGLITDMANYGNMTDGAEAVSFTTTIDTDTGEVSSRETHSYTDTYGNKNTVTYKSKGG